MVRALRPRPRRRRGVRCSRWRFQQLVSRAYARLPSQVQATLTNIAVTVEDMPSSAEADGHGPLGLYQGTPVGERGTGYSMVLPDKVTVYRVPLLRACHDQRDLAEEITLTLLHEIGHHVGLDDDDLPF